MQRIILLVLLFFSWSVSGQPPRPSALFIAEAGMLDFEFDGAYIIPFGSDAGIERVDLPAPIFAFYDESRPLEDNHIGMANVDRLEPGRTIITPFFRTGASPRLGERILVDLPIKLPNPFYRSITHQLASNAITLTDLAGNILLDLSSFEDDGLYIEYIILSIFRDDLIRTSLEMRGRMDNFSINEGRYKGKKILEVMGSPELTDIAGFVEYFNVYPGHYMGYGHTLSELFALWAVNGGPEAETREEETVSSELGFTLVDDPETGYPRVDKVSQAYYGRKGLIIAPGSHLMFFEGRSMKGVSVADMTGMLEGEKYQSASLSIQTPEKRTFDIELPYMPLPDDPGWKGRAEWKEDDGRKEQ